MSNVDLNKIQGVIENEITRATNAERKRIVSLVQAFAKELVEEIKNGGEDDEGDDEGEAPVVKKKTTKKKAASKTVKKEVEEEEEEEEEEEGGEAIDGSEFEADIKDVEDHEVDESPYFGKKVGELRAICKKRNITVPKTVKGLDIAKLLILVDEQ